MSAIVSSIVRSIVRSVVAGGSGIGTPFEHIGNGGFDDDTGWTLGSGWSISGGLANNDGTANGFLSRTMEAPLQVGVTYTVRLTVSNPNAQNLQINALTPDPPATIYSGVAATGLLEFTYTPVGAPDEVIRIRGTTLTGAFTIDDWSITRA